MADKRSDAARRQGVYFAKEAMEIIGGTGESFSGRVNSIIVRFGAMVAAAMPEFTLGEWCAICDANNGTWTMAEHGDIDPARYLWANVHDSGPDGIDAKWGIDHRAFAEQLRTLPYASQVAALEVVTRFWGMTDEHLPHAEALRRAGAKIKGEGTP